VDKSTDRYSLTCRAWTCARLVGRNVKRIRQDTGLTQEELAERSGFSQQYISGLEQGRRNPTIVSIYELATALGVSHMELVRPTEER
jgi:transcriptional regulator with XRE-family HTH domain